MKKILLVSEYFAPISSIASIRFTKILKYLSRTNQYQFYVISSKNGYSKDDILQNDLKSISDYVSVVYIDIMDNFIDNCFRKNTKQSVQGGGKQTTSSTGQGSAVKYKPYKECSFKEKIIKYIMACKYIYNEWVFAKKGYNAAKEFGVHFDCVISSYGDAGTHKLARLMQKKQPGLPWIADFRDPAVAFYRPPIFNNYFKKIEKTAIQYASHITGVTDCALGSCVSSPKAKVIINGFDREDVSVDMLTDYYQNDSKFHICYTGKIYLGKSNAYYLFKVLHELIQEGKINSDDVIVDYAGADYALLEAQANEFNLSQMTRNHGYLNRSDALSMQRSSQLLLVLSWNDKDEKNVLTGKFMEYLMSGKNIYALVNGTIPGSIIKKIIDTTKTGYCFEEAEGGDSFNKAKAFFFDRYHEWKTTGECVFYGEKNEIDQYSYEQIAEQYQKIINASIKGE